MNQKGTLGVLTEKLSPNGHQRLFEFLDVTDTAAAARFRGWLSTAPDGEIASAADILNRASHGNQLVAWWRSRDRQPMSPGEASGPQMRSRTPLEHMHSQARGRAANADLTVGGIWLAIGLLVTLGSYSLAANTGGGSYVIASGAIIYGAIRLFRGFRG